MVKLMGMMLALVFVAGAAGLYLLAEVSITRRKK